MMKIRSITFLLILLGFNPVTAQQDAVTTFLGGLKGSFRPMVCRYEGSKLIDSKLFLAGNAEQASKPLGITSFLNWKKHEVKSGETRVIEL